MRHKIDTPKYLTLSKFQTPKYLPTFPIKNYGDYHTLGLWYLIAYFTNTIHSRRSMEEVHWDKNPSVLGYFHLLRYELPWYLWKSIQQTLPKIFVLHKSPLDLVRITVIFIQPSAFRNKSFLLHFVLSSSFNISMIVTFLCWKGHLISRDEEMTKPSAEESKKPHSNKCKPVFLHDFHM